MESKFGWQKHREEGESEEDKNSSDSDHNDDRSPQPMTRDKSNLNIYSTEAAENKYSQHELQQVIES